MIGTTWVNAVIWLYAAFFGQWLLQWWLGRHLHGLGLIILEDAGRARSFYHVLLAPGVAVHELSHWLMAKALFVPTGRVNLFRPTSVPDQNKMRLGYVEIASTDVWRASLIGVAPLVSGVLAILAGAWVLGVDVGRDQPFFDLATSFWRSLRGPLAVPVVYILFSVSNTMFPSGEDRKPWLVALLIPGSIILALYTWHLVPPLPSSIENFLFQACIRVILAFSLTVLIDLALSAVVWFLEAILSRLLGHSVEYI